MLKPLALGSLLLLTTALCAPGALAQTAPPPPSASSPAADPQVPEEEEEVEISAPGADPTEQAAEEIVVTGTRTPNIVRRVPEVVSVLSSADIARTGEGDIAGALQRVTGLSVVGNGFVFVRGLGDRYSLALLNGLALPSPEPLRRTVPLDIFPTSVLSSVLVQKSYSVNYPGEFGGGVINLTTSALPKESFFAVGVSGSVDTETTAKLGYTYYGSDTDFTGFDDGTRDIPAALRDAFSAGVIINEGGTFSRDQIKGFATSLVNAETTLLQRNLDIPANYGFDFSGGSTFDVGTLKLGVIASAGFSNSWRTRDARQQSGSDTTVASDFRAVRTDNRIIVNGLLGFGLRFGEHDIRLTNVYIRDTLKQGRLAAGFNLSIGEQNPNEPAQALRQRTAWFERQLINTQIVGEFDFGDIDVDLRGGYANSQREAPYERNFSYVFSPEARDYVNNLTAVGQTASISFSELEEDVYNGGIDLSYKLPTERSITLGVGHAYLDTKRTSFRRDFAFRPADGLALPIAQERPDFLLSDFNINNNNILLVETSALAGAAAFDGDLRVHGVYGQITADIIPDKLRFNGGVRYEDGRQSVLLIDLFDQGGIDQAPPIENQFFLPAATLTYDLAQDMQVRVNASKTLARPQFRELAPQLFLDIESDRQFIGNPFLQDSELYNAEARYEWYFGRDQRFSIAGFYKRIDSPIEAVATFAGGGQLQTTFANAPSANLYGAEVEVQKFFPLANFGGDFFGTRRAVVIANYTYSDSKIKVRDGDQTILNDTQGVRPANQVFRDGGQLTGQSRHLANLQLGLESTSRLSQQTLLVTYASKRVTNRGPILGEITQPDIFEEPGLRLDFVAREGFRFLGFDAELKFEARNLTGENYEEFQTFENSRLDFNTFDLGRTFSLGISARF